MIATVASGLGLLLDEVVFVGGAVAELYVTSPGAASVRPTVDVDMVTNIVSRSELTQLEQQLRELDFANDISPDAPICRWIYQGIQVDVMPTEKNVLGFSNPWYLTGFTNRITANLISGTTIHILPPAIYLCTKLEATKDRGYPDLRESHDFEDIVYLLDNRPEILAEIQQSDMQIQAFLSATFQELKTNYTFDEAIRYALPGTTKKVHSMIEQIISVV